ncbi:MAG: transglutaminase-like domain-containing protein [Hespellia sp.]|nr:transglutaminase-like domain-containing protein [Hespellia sp.]
MIKLTHHFHYIIVPFFLVLFLSLIISGCSSSSNAAKENSEKKSAPPRSSAAKVLVPEAPATTVYGNDIVSIDVSNVSQGYIMVNYSGFNDKVKLQIETPDAVDYTYLITDLNQYAVYPLSGGNGSYTLSILESVDRDSDMYSIAFTQAFDVTLADEFLPYLYPNHYVNFTADSALVSKGEELASDCYSDLDVVTNIYDFVIKNITYDEDKAKDVPYGYTPDPDETLGSKTGICFDYASLMSGMLRSQNVPTKLEVGYSGDVYHAWISCYVDEVGWVDNIIEFDGKNWSLMDPTLAAGNKKSAVKKYIGDGSKYTVKYHY